jgi:hypothetical protein
MEVSQIGVTLSSDSGLITDSVSTSYDLGLIYLAETRVSSQFILPSFTVSTLPPAEEILRTNVVCH